MITSDTEAGVRLAAFITVFAAMVVWELVAPRRASTLRKPKRWASNLGLVVLNSLVLRMVAPLGAVGVAIAAESRSWGVLHCFSMPNWAAVLTSVVLLDLAIYLQHVMFHAVPALWRFHMVHHADLDFDVTTGLRFHTIEILLSFGIKMLAIVALGPPPLAVFLFEVILNATSMFNHSNVRLSSRFDSLLRYVVVTPDMHRVHHSAIPSETNSNFGFNLPWWDRLLGTYQAQPREGHDDMTIGLTGMRDEKLAETLHWMMALPFMRLLSDYPINRRWSTSHDGERLSTAEPPSERGA